MQSRLRSMRSATRHRSCPETTSIARPVRVNRSTGVGVLVSVRVETVYLSHRDESRVRHSFRRPFTREPPFAIRVRKMGFSIPLLSSERPTVANEPIDHAEVRLEKLRQIEALGL